VKITAVASLVVAALLTGLILSEASSGSADAALILFIPVLVAWLVFVIVGTLAVARAARRRSAGDRRR